MKEKGKRGTFIVEIKDTQTHSWQGNVTWVDAKEKRPFRSALELIRLMDSAVEQELTKAFTSFTD